MSGLDGPVSRHLNRPLSRPISRLVAPLPISADQWSYVGCGLVCAGAGAFALGAHRAGALLAHAGSVLDGVDGEVARAQGTAGAAGALLDLTLDRCGDVALLAGLALGAGGTRVDWLLALTAAHGIVTASVVKERVGAEGQSVAQLQRDEASGTPVDRVLPYTGRDGRLFAITVLGLLRQPRLTLAWLAATATLRLLRRVPAARALLRGAGQ